MDNIDKIANEAVDAILGKIKRGQSDEIDEILAKVLNDKNVIYLILQELEPEIDELKDKCKVISRGLNDHCFYDFDCDYTADEQDVEQLEHEIAELESVVFKLWNIL